MFLLILGDTLGLRSTTEPLVKIKFNFGLQGSLLAPPHAGHCVGTPMHMQVRGQSRVRPRCWGTKPAPITGVTPARGARSSVCLSACPLNKYMKREREGARIHIADRTNSTCAASSPGPPETPPHPALHQQSHMGNGKHREHRAGGVTSASYTFAIGKKNPVVEACSSTDPALAFLQSTDTFTWNLLA